jgi:hypothetical protein
MVGGMTQDNAANCGTCTDSLVAKGYEQHIFYNCFLHVLNLACQAAIEVYDPFRKKKASRIRLVDFEDFSGSEDSNDEDDPNYDDEDEYAEELKGVDNRCNAVMNVSLAISNYRQEDSLYSLIATIPVVISLLNASGFAG